MTRSPRPACRSRSRFWSRNFVQLGLSIDVINEDEQTVDFTEDTSRDLLSNLDRINLSGYEKTAD